MAGAGIIHEQQTEHVRKVWDDQANSWYAQRESLLADTSPVHDWLVRTVAPEHGQRLLEIAAGPGDTGFLAASLFGKGLPTPMPTESLYRRSV